MSSSYAIIRDNSALENDISFMNVFLVNRRGERQITRLYGRGNFRRIHLMSLWATIFSTSHVVSLTRDISYYDMRIKKIVGLDHREFTK